MYCLEPLQIQPKRDGQLTGEVFDVQCRKCSSCVATRKNDIAGKLMAEAQHSADAYFLTLTYADEPEDFVYRDVQLMLKQLRIFFERSVRNPAKLRYFCVGERGDEKGRIHWHLLLFFDRPVRLRSPKKGRLWAFWEHGWTQIARLDQSDRVRRVRYCAKYAAKTVGQTHKATRPRSSLRLGEAAIMAHAISLADAGLPLYGTYNVDGMIFDTGPRAGQRQKFYIQGILGWLSLDAYLERWEELRPGTVPPQTRYLEAKENGQHPHFKRLEGGFYMPDQREVSPHVRDGFSIDASERENYVKKSEALERASAAQGWLNPTYDYTVQNREDLVRRFEYVEALEKQRDRFIDDLEAYFEGREEKLDRAVELVSEFFDEEHRQVFGRPYFYEARSDQGESEARLYFDEARNFSRFLNAAFSDADRKYARLIEAARKSAADEKAIRREEAKADRARRKAYREKRFLEVNGTRPRDIAARRAAR